MTPSPAEVRLVNAIADCAEQLAALLKIVVERARKRDAAGNVTVTPATP